MTIVNRTQMTRRYDLPFLSHVKIVTWRCGGGVVVGVPYHLQNIFAVFDCFFYNKIQNLSLIHGMNTVWWEIMVCIDISFNILNFMDHNLNLWWSRGNDNLYSVMKYYDVNLSKFADQSIGTSVHQKFKI